LTEWEQFESEDLLIDGLCMCAIQLNHKET